MSSFQIVIPTHERAHRQDTLKAFPASLREEVLVVTSTKEDADSIKKIHGHKNIIVAKGTTGIANKRHWIMKNLKADNIFMLDDDMTFYIRCPRKLREVVDGRWKPVDPARPTLLLRMNDKQFIKMFDDLRKAMDRYPAVALSSRMGNDTQEASWHENGRMMHAIGYSRDVYMGHKIRFDSVKFREDFHVTLSMLRLGYKNTVYYEHCCSPFKYGAPGGASGERTIEDSNAEAEKLAALHPGLVRVVDKNYAGVPRKEVVVSWKKAFNHDQKAEA